MRSSMMIGLVAMALALVACKDDKKPEETSKPTPGAKTEAPTDTKPAAAEPKAEAEEEAKPADKAEEPKGDSEEELDGEFD
ncbi:MAG: hypothetical protein KC731_22190 [Myxococcales bacterium]|nr:hypothetical protein [Myxococcales bacterium]